MSIHDDCIGIYDTSVILWLEGKPEDHQERLWREFRSVVARMHARGWAIYSDPELDERYPDSTIARGTRVAHRGAMRMRIELRGRCIETQIHLDGRFDNPNGHRYDFRKLRHMTGLQRLRCIVAMAAVVRKSLELGYKLPPKLLHRLKRECNGNLLRLVRNLAEQRRHVDPLDGFNDSWLFSSDWALGRDRFERDETGWPTVAAYDPGGRNVDRDGVPLRNGQTRYLRDRQTGRIVRGTAFTNMNEMWMLDTGVGRRWVHRTEFFSCDDPSALPRRLVPHQPQRIEREIERAMKTKDFERVGALGTVRARMVA